MERGPQDGRMTTLMQLLDDLEEQITTRKRFPGTNTVYVDSSRMLEVIDRLRQQIPLEIEQARRIMNQRQQIIIEAQNEARRIVDEAHESAEYLVSESGIMAEARQRGEERLRQAQSNAERTRDGASSFAFSVIDRLQETLHKELLELERARDVIRDRHESETTSR